MACPALGCLLEGKVLLDGSDSAHGEYTTHSHLAQHIDLLGSQKELEARGTKIDLHFGADGVSHSQTRYPHFFEYP
jgi:hypothetical protein